MARVRLERLSSFNGFLEGVLLLGEGLSLGEGDLSTLGFFSGGDFNSNGAGRLVVCCVVLSAIFVS